MLLKKLVLENIRSYQDETVEFPKGITLLSGDIGSGKSSILLGLEFALFGASRTDLPGEALLRKGTTQASATLHFQLDNKEFEIKRVLKKDKQGIRQLPGHIITNGVKNELTPVELKAKIISLLGYPAEYLTKKNFIFRYTVYTPQESMKKILQESSEIRMNVLRKIFQVDKYKIIRENAAIFLRETKTSIAVLKEATKLLSTKKEEMKKTVLECSVLEKKQKEDLEQVEKAKVLLKNKKEILEQIEQKQRTFMDWKKEVSQLESLLKEQETTSLKLQEQITILEKELEQVPSLGKEEAKIALEQLKQKKELTIKENSILREKRLFLEKMLKEDISFNEGQKKSLLSEIEQKKAIDKVIDLEPAQKQIQEHIEQSAKIQSLISLGEGKMQTLLSLDSCPTCMQQVSSSHKENCKVQEEKKIEQAKLQLSQIMANKQATQEKLLLLQKEQQLMQENKTKVVQLEAQLQILLAKEKEYLEKKKQKEKHTLELEQLGVPNLELEKNLTEKIAKVEAIVKEHLKREHLQKQQEMVQKQLQELLLRKKEVKNKVDLLKEKKLQDLSLQLIENKKLVDQALIEEKEKSLELAKVKTNLNHLTLAKEKLSKEIKEMSERATLLETNQNFLHWCEGHLLPLTKTIEKHLMQVIYQHFNEIFREWFAILIEDTGMYVRLDESFTPIIEQNGHEISFGNLSGGEKTSTALAYRLALNRVINDVIHQINTKNLLILDEPTDGFSAQQLDKVRDVLEKLNLNQTIIVSHEAKVESFVDHVLRVEKEQSSKIR